MLEILPIMLALCVMLFHACYALNHAGIIDTSPYSDIWPCNCCYFMTKHNPSPLHVLNLDITIFFRDFQIILYSLTFVVCLEKVFRITFCTLSAYVLCIATYVVTYFSRIKLCWYFKNHKIHEMFSPQKLQ